MDFNTRIAPKDKVYLPVITALSIVIPIVVALLIYMPRTGTYTSSVLSGLPLFHAILNGLTALFLVLGYYFIRSKRIVLHRTSMLSALALSIIFLVSYVTYH